MVDAVDLLQCPVCGDFYVPENTATGRLVPHCRLPTDLTLSLGQLAERSIHTDFCAIEARVFAYSQAAQLGVLTGKLPYFIDEEV